MLERLLDRLMRRAVALAARAGPPAGGTHGDTAAAERAINTGNGAERAGRIAEACVLYREAVAAAPGWSRAHLNLGMGLEAAGDIAGALGAYRTALTIDPADPYANYNLGRLLHLRGEPREADRHLRAALERKPDFAEARIVLSAVHEAAGALAAAAGELELALRQRPDDAGALYNYGTVLSKLGRAAEAEAAMRRALAAKPAFPEAHAALYEIYGKQGRTEAAVTQLELLLELRPDWADAWYNYGMLLKKLWRTAEAEAAFRRAVALDPKHVDAQRLLGGILLSQSRVSEALAGYHEARRSNPGRLDLESAELLAMLFAEDVSDEEVFARHRALGARLETAHAARFAPFRNSRDAGRRLRIGYVSGDFAYHPVALFLVPLIERHDRSAFEIYCYSVGNQADEVTRKMVALADHWRDAAVLSASELADAINRDGIDILIDLSGHSGIPALETFAMQPAPVQASWLGYLGTTGMTRIGYRLCDRHTDPPGIAERFHTETLVRLPNSQWCYRPLITAEISAEPPFARNGFVTFGSFNQAAKLSRSVRGLWSEILLRVPGSRLLVLGVPEGRAADGLLADMARHGVDSGRITVAPHVPLDEYFRRFNAVDIALDTSPYSGGTTTCDTLWMGVPVITAPGSRSVSRSTTSILWTVGLDEWIAATPADYVRLAVESAARVPVSVGPRLELRERMRRSPMMDETGFARDVEAVYRWMWSGWCSRT